MLAVLLASGLGACAAPPLAQIEAAFVPMPSAPCTAVVERLEHLDQPSALGFSAVELLARVAGESSSSLDWLPPEPSSEYTLGYGPESGRSNLRLRVLPAAGEVRYRHELMSDDAPEGTDCADGVLDVPVSVSIQSDTQALDETFSARLEASTVYRAQFSHRFAPGTLSGGFAVTELSSLDPERTFSVGALSLQVVLWEDGSQGCLSTEIQSRYTPKASAAAREAWPAPPEDSASLALWPSAEACGLPASSRLPSDAKVLGFSVVDVLAALASEDPRELTWATGDATALELDFVSPASELCQAVGDSLGFETTVRVRTADGRLAAEVPVQINASNEAGTIGEVTVQTTESAASARPLAALGNFQSVAGSNLAASNLAASNLAASNLAASNPAASNLSSKKAGRGANAAQERAAPEEVRVDLDASFRGGLSAGTLTLSGVDTSHSLNAPVRELASGRWAH